MICCALQVLYRLTYRLSLIVCNISDNYPFECQLDLHKALVSQSSTPVPQMRSFNASAIVFLPIALSMLSRSGFCSNLACTPL